MENTNFTPEDEAMLRDSLKRCSPETIEAAVEFRKTGDVSKVNTVILGIIARYAEPEKRPLLDNPSDDMVLAQDLNLDSLTMVEIVLAVEDATGISISNEDVQSLRTIGDVKNYIAKKASA
ncbi:MAG: acyl carrier protein [Opitutales bacterium]|nr:acyl carrier protein [Opitutales bacterium]